MATHRPVACSEGLATQRAWIFILAHGYFLKGALDNILKFYFWLNLIYHVKCNC